MAIWESPIVACWRFLAAARCILAADQYYHDAERAESAGRPRAAYNRRRRGDDWMRLARRLCGRRGLPWGVP